MASRVSDNALRALLKTYARSPRCTLTPPSLRRWLRPHRALARSASSLAAPMALASIRGGSTTDLKPATTARSRGYGRLRRGYATAAQSAKRDIAVLGGGLTGLSTAYYLTKFHPDAKITIYESSDRLGGWVDTEKAEVRSDEGTTETVVFERGPRTVAPSRGPRYDDLVLYELIDELKLQPHTYTLPKSAGPSARRYIYYPDHLVDVTPPTADILDPIGTALSFLNSAKSVLTEPLFEGFIPSVLTMAASTERRKASLSDVQAGMLRCAFPEESIGEYFTARFGRPDLVNNLLSAVVHGIYGGDVWKLSMHDSMMARVAVQEYLPQHPTGTWMKLEDLYLARDLLYRNEMVQATAQQSRGWSFIGFYNGFGTLTDAMAEALKKNANVTFKLGEPVTSVAYDKSHRKVKIKTKDKHATLYDKVVSTLFSGTLARLTGDALPSLRDTSAVTIQLVNLWYPTPRLNAPNTGFGYLVPNSPAVANPYSALGVIFDSDREAARGLPRDPAVLSAGRMDTVAGTKLTVMLGGHHWASLPASSWPDADQAADMAKATAQLHLGIPASERAVASAKVCRECIPQQTVGHQRRMAAAHEELLEAFGGGQLAVAGGSYSPPGVLPSLRAGRDVAMQIAGRGYQTDGQGRTAYGLDGHVGPTGLARFLKNEWALVPKAHLPFRYGNGLALFD
ncbi:Protoporphyrinogen oxidase [Pleurostoma richardsiae]|uniref:Protoporphyrinogen oxidase n=1 Tax=Pleurostoma richardsiae TaxID=41990 RepID=A0AA38RVG9_9PEZI|nr:Protoporphyrinogen oxidase [Pleurostoma richardsiae]